RRTSDNSTSRATGTQALVAAAWDNRGVRALLVCAALAACGRPEVVPAARPPAAPSVVPPAPGVNAQVPGTGGAAINAGGAAPGARLPDGVAPVAYDLTLEIDPERASFTGRVAITIAVTA